MTSYLVVEEGQQKQDVLYGDNATSGVIMEENALQRNAGQRNDQRNVTLTSFLSLVTAHARLARQSQSCVRDSKTRVFVLCDDGSSLTEVSCRKASLGCMDKNGICDKIYTTCTIKGKLKNFVTDCKCRE